MRIHHLKTKPEYFQAVIDERKPFEIRLNDRKFKKGDRVMLEEYESYKTYGTCPDIDSCRALAETFDENRRFDGCPLNRKMCHSYGEDIYTGRRCLVQIKEIFNLDNAGKDLEGYVAFTFDILNVIQKEERQGGIKGD